MNLSTIDRLCLSTLVMKFTIWSCSSWASLTTMTGGLKRLSHEISWYILSLVHFMATGNNWKLLRWIPVCSECPIGDENHKMVLRIFWHKPFNSPLALSHVSLHPDFGQALLTNPLISYVHYSNQVLMQKFTKYYKKSLVKWRIRRVEGQ
jgi:hypothetical protein